MRRLVLIVVLLALALPTAARAADLTAVPREFSPDEKRLRVHASLPQRRSASASSSRLPRGEAIGWIAAPERRELIFDPFLARTARRRRRAGTAATASGSWPAVA